MAEYRAAEDALHLVYLTNVLNELISLQTSTFLTSLYNVFDVKGKEQPHIPADLGMAEVEYGRSGRVYKTNVFYGLLIPVLILCLNGRVTLSFCRPVQH